MGAGLPLERWSEPNIWRTVVKEIYESCGSPKVPGYSSAEVQGVLAGRPVADARSAHRMVGALLDTIQNAIQSPAAGGWMPMQAVGAIRIGVDNHSNLTLNLAPGFREDFDTAAPQEPAAHYGTTYSVQPYDAGETAPTTRVLPATPVSDRTRADVKIDDSLSCGTEPVASPARSAGGRRSRRRASRTGPPPSPDAVVNCAQYMQVLRQLREWSGMSLRDLEEASRKVSSGRDWIPRATLSDALNRDTLPRAPLLSTLTTALGLPPADRARWEIARRRLTGEGPVTGEQEPAVPAPDVTPAQETPAQETDRIRRGKWLRRNRNTA